MMDLIFSPERAARGEPVQYVTDIRNPVWEDCHYIGLNMDGYHVVQAKTGCMFTCSLSELRMKPVPTKKWVLEFDTDAAAQWAHSAIRFANATRPVGYGIPPIKEVEIKPEG